MIWEEIRNNGSGSLRNIMHVCAIMVRGMQRPVAEMVSRDDEDDSAVFVFSIESLSIRSIQ